MSTKHTHTVGNIFDRVGRELACKGGSIRATLLPYGGAWDVEQLIWPPDADEPVRKTYKNIDVWQVCSLLNQVEAEF